MAATHANKLFRHDEVARIVGPDEIDVISPVSAAYGLAIILDSNLAVVDYVQKDDAPRKLQPDELALIATDGLLRVSYLSGVPNVSGDKEVGVTVDRLTEEDGISGKEHTIRGKVVLEFRIDRYNRKIANHLHALMKDRDSDRLTKKEFLKDFGEDTKDNIANFTQTFIDENGRPKGGPKFKARGRADLSPTLEEYGVEFRNILCNVDRRSNLARAIWPSFQYDYKLVVGAKMMAYAISITSSVVGLLFAIGILPPELPPVVTVGEQVNGTASVTATAYDCQTDQMCTVDSGGRVTVSAKPASNYALTGWNCPDCSNDLGEENPIVISGIMDDLTISPIFKPLATVNVRSNDSQLGDVSCTANGMTSDSCNATAGKEIILRANQQSINASDSSVGEFVEWENCPPRWCAGVDRTLRELRLTVPERDGPDTISISAKFRKDSLIRLRINPVEPFDAGISSPVVTGCSSPRCVMTREGITDVYTFQQNSESRSPLPLTLGAPAPDMTTSNYAFDTWMCNGGPCSLLDNPANPRTRISLNNDVTITPIYTEHIIITIEEPLTGGSIDLGSLPPSCIRMRTATRCRFSPDNFDGLQLNVVAEADNGDFRFSGWTCTGSWCRQSGLSVIENRVFREFVNASLTLTPVFVSVERTRLNLSNSLNGNIQVQADCEPDCVGEAGWETRVIASRQRDNLLFERWECMPNSSSCPSGSDLTNPVITVKLDHDVTLVPVYSQIPALTLEFSDTQGAQISCVPSDCSATEGSSIRFTLESEPSMMRFREWICSPSSSVHCNNLFNQFRKSTTITAGDLSSNTRVTLKLGFDTIQTAGVVVGAADDGGGTADPNCGTNCVREVPWDVFVTATPASGYEFVQWVCVSGSCPTGNITRESISFEITEDTEIKPSFRTTGLIPPDSVSLTFGGVTGGSASAGCGSDCSKAPGWITTVTASPNSGYMFSRWQCSGSCPTGSASTNANISLTINEDTRITPVFTLQQPVALPPPPPDEMVTLIINVGAGGEIDRAGEFSSDCDRSQCTYTFPVGSSIHVDADPLSGYTEGRWSRVSGNSFSSASNFDIDITLTRDTELEVTFVREEVDIVCDVGDVVGVSRWSSNPVGDFNGLVAVTLHLSENCDRGDIAFEVYLSSPLRDSRIASLTETARGASIAGSFLVPACPTGSGFDRSFYVRLSDGREFKSSRDLLNQTCEVL